VCETRKFLNKFKTMLKEFLQFDKEKVSEKIENFIREKVEEFKREGVILGISGGIDSTVCAYLCKRALGKDKVFGLLLPEKDVPKESLEDAKFVVKNLGIKYKIEDLTKIIKDYGIYKLIKIPGLTRNMKANVAKAAFNFYYKKTGKNPFSEAILGVKNDTPYYNYLRKVTAYMRIKHRARALVWYKYAEIYNLLVVGCCNKTEELIGWFVKYGDSACDISPIGSLYKTQVWKLAEYLKIPKRIILKTPTPDMLPGITDEFSIGLPYKTIDLILIGLEKKVDEETIAKECSVDLSKINYIKELKKKSAHMRELPPSPIL